ncbi:MAG: GNAT family protein [Candidatus Bathyarchaeia archaeon]
MLEGKRINLRLAEREDVPLLVEWLNDVEFAGGYQHFPDQLSKAELEKRILEHKLYQTEWIDFIIEKKDGTKIGWTCHYISAPNFGWTEIGYAIIPSERNKGYGTEAVQMLVDYLFLTREIIRIQAVINTQDKASRRVLEKVGFKKEGALRKALWDAKGKWADGHLYSILREEWKEPKVLETSHIKNKG